MALPIYLPNSVNGFPFPHTLSSDFYFSDHMCQRRRMDFFLELTGRAFLRPSSSVSCGRRWQGLLHSIMPHCLSEDSLQRFSLPSFRFHGLINSPVTRHVSGFCFVFSVSDLFSHRRTIQSSLAIAP